MNPQAPTQHEQTRKPPSFSALLFYGVLVALMTWFFRCWVLASPDTQALVISFMIAVAISMFVYTDMKQKEIDALLLRVHREDYVQLIELIFDTIHAYKTPALRKKLVQKIKDFEKRHLVLGAPHLMTLFRRYESILQQKPPQTDLENALDGLIEDIRERLAVG